MFRGASPGVWHQYWVPPDPSLPRDTMGPVWGNFLSHLRQPQQGTAGAHGIQNPQQTNTAVQRLRELNCRLNHSPQEYVKTHVSNLNRELLTEIKYSGSGISLRNQQNVQNIINKLPVTLRNKKITTETRLTPTSK